MEAYPKWIAEIPPCGKMQACGECCRRAWLSQGSQCHPPHHIVSIPCPPQPSKLPSSCAPASPCGSLPTAATMARTLSHSLASCSVSSSYRPPLSGGRRLLTSIGAPLARQAVRVEAVAGLSRGLDSAGSLMGHGLNAPSAEELNSPVALVSGLPSSPHLPRFNASASLLHMLHLNALPKRTAHASEALGWPTHCRSATRPPQPPPANVNSAAYPALHRFIRLKSSKTSWRQTATSWWC